MNLKFGLSLVIWVNLNRTADLPFSNHISCEISKFLQVNVFFLLSGTYTVNIYCRIIKRLPPIRTVNGFSVSFCSPTHRLLILGVVNVRFGIKKWAFYEKVIFICTTLLISCLVQSLIRLKKNYFKNH